MASEAVGSSWAWEAYWLAWLILKGAGGAVGAGLKAACWFVFSDGAFVAGELFLCVVAFVALGTQAGFNGNGCYVVCDGVWGAGFAGCLLGGLVVEGFEGAGFADTILTLVA